MVRAPCCDKIGLKKGPWSPDEDQILISFVQKNGHPNWRALPKLAGLKRCGKSCRLRWTNYLSPEIKRGNFTKEEEDTIIQLHEMLGNRWSAIAAKLPGRTDNEIKNVWHTHLKKRLSNYEPSKSKPTKSHSKTLFKSSGSDPTSNFTNIIQNNKNNNNNNENDDNSDQSSPSSDMSSMTQSTSMMIEENVGHKADEFMQIIDESFWADEEVQFESSISNYGMVDDDMDFWYNLFVRAGEFSELAEF